MINFTDWLKKKSPPTSDWRTYPILLRWNESGRMTDALKVIEKKIDYLISQGSNSKIKEWLSGDLALTQITAERYVLDSLRYKNTSLVENLTGGGVDAYLIQGESKIGVEVTTVNQSIAEWIFNERILMFLDFNKYSATDGIKISYDLNKIKGLEYTLDLIEEIGSTIIQDNFGVVGNVNIEKIADSGSYINWNNESPDNNFFETVKSSLCRILTSKSEQLGKNQQNLLFIGVNQLPIGPINPSIFRDLTGNSNVHPEWVLELEKIVIELLPENVLGVCFFVYTLPSEDMMYPLHIFWRDSNQKVPIIL